MTMITPSYLGETIEYSSLHACRSTLEDPTYPCTLQFAALELPCRHSRERSDGNQGPVRPFPTDDGGVLGAKVAAAHLRD